MFVALTKLDGGTNATIHRLLCRITCCRHNLKCSISCLYSSNNYYSESLLAALRANATEKANGNVFVSVIHQPVNAVLLNFLHYVLLLQELTFLYLKFGITSKNGTKEMKRIMAKNMNGSTKTNPELKQKMQDHFDKGKGNIKGFFTSTRK